MPIRKPIVYLLTACAVVELLMFVGLCALGDQAFMAFIWSPDTPEYQRVALQLAETFTLTPSRRTIGYPLVLSVANYIGGRGYWMHSMIAAQLIINLVFTWGCWILLERLVPAVRWQHRTIVTLLFFWAGLGMAFNLLTDFMAAFLFGVFLFGMLFWRTPSSVLLSGGALALATLTRPTFTFIPFLLPIAAYLVGRATTKVPWQHLVAFTLFSVAATGISASRQYAEYGYTGPAPYVLTLNIQETLYNASAEGGLTTQDATAYLADFEGEIAKRAGQAYATLSPGEQERHARQIFVEALAAHPRVITSRLLKNFTKYLFAPIEGAIQKLTTLYAGEQTYLSGVRPILVVAGIPIWLLALAPPVRSPNNFRMYYLLMLTCVLYVVGISAITNFAGERIRFPVLPFMLPVMAWNIHRLYGYLHGPSPAPSRDRTVRT
jgi:hypothetical protein